MLINRLLVGGLQTSLNLLKQHVADISDAEMVVRPVPGANHVLWQLSHLTALHAITASTVVPGASVPIPAKLPADAKISNTSDNPADFASKAELLVAYEKANHVIVKAVETMSEADLEKPGPEAFRAWAPTIGDLISLTAQHTNMHMGQIQVLRRKLGKPLIF